MTILETKMTKSCMNEMLHNKLMHVSQCPLERHNIFWVGIFLPPYV